MQVLHKYRYDGIVMQFDNIISRRWVGETMALSEGKARSNLIYQYKMQNGKSRNSNIKLPGKVILVV